MPLSFSYQTANLDSLAAVGVNDDQNESEAFGLVRVEHCAEGFQQKQRAGTPPRSIRFPKLKVARVLEVKHSRNVTLVDAPLLESLAGELTIADNEGMERVQLERLAKVRALLQ